MKVLIADDSMVMRRLLQNCLQTWQYEVVEAEDGAQAWELFQAEDFQIVVSDWMMPEMDGLELVRRIRGAEKQAGYVFVLLLTAQGETDLREAASSAKAFCSDTFFHCASENIQIHGGVGFTWEYDCHLFFKRAKSDESWLGSPAEHRERVARLLQL